MCLFERLLKTIIKSLLPFQNMEINLVKKYFDTCYQFSYISTGHFPDISLPTAICSSCSSSYATDMSALIQRNYWPDNPSLRAGNLAVSDD